MSNPSYQFTNSARLARYGFLRAEPSCIHFGILLELGRRSASISDKRKGLMGAKKLDAAGVGMIGLGIMGSAMTANLIRAGFKVAGFDVARERCREHQKAG